ncbi:MAG TPA: hypothetical protein VIX19_06335, partial [Terriglobales bacterium]
VHNQDRVGFVATLYFVNDTFAVNRHPRNKSRFPAGDGRLGREIHALEGQLWRSFNPRTQIGCGFSLGFLIDLP